MTFTSVVRWRSGNRGCLIALAAFSCIGLILPVSAESAVLVAAQMPASSASFDPTRPEVQPPLDVDRDPIPSPDISTPPTTGALVPAAPQPTVSAGASRPANAPPGPSEIEKQQNGIYVLHTNVDEVLLNCAVLDAKGRLVTDLNRSNFQVWEDGVPQSINSVLHLDLPVSMGILIDNSGSMRDKRGAVNDAAFRLLTSSNPQDEAFIVNFSDHAYLDQGFTTDRVALDRGISRFDSAGTTALYDAVAASADELSKHGKDRRQVLLIVTDGADNASSLTLQEAIRRVQGLGGPVVYSIGLLFDTGKQDAARARQALELLSEQTGGVAYFPDSLQEVSTIAAQVARDIREQYVIDYHSSKPFTLGGYRTVRVEARASHRGPLFVRTKRGYFAQPLQPSHLQDAQN